MNRVVLGAVLASFILILAIVHLGVSIGVLVRFRHYDNVFRPEKGLAGFNIVISIYGLIIGGFGLFSVLTYRGILSKIVAFACIPLALFAVVSLITALIINSRAVDYVRSHFLYHMNNYPSLQDSRNIINEFQTHYVCCGDDTWLDWISVPLDAGGGGSSGTTRIVSTVTPPSATGAGSSRGTTSAGSNRDTTNSGSNRDTTNSGSNRDTTSSGSNRDTTNSGSNRDTTSSGSNRDTTNSGSSRDTTSAGSAIDRSTTSQNDIGTTTTMRRSSDTGSSNNDAANSKLSSDTMKGADNKSPLLSDKNTYGLDLDLKQSFLQQAIRQRRQSQSSNSGMSSSSIPSNVVVPQSCCTTDLSGADDLGNLYCKFSINNVTGNLHKDGCLSTLAKLAVGQTLGFVVINSFLFLFALAAIPVFIKTDPYPIPTENGFINQSVPQYQQHNTLGQYNTAIYNPGASIGAVNPTYSAYY